MTWAHGVLNNLIMATNMTKAINTKTAATKPAAGYMAYKAYNNRPLSGMAKIINITGRIKSYEGNVPYKYTFDELPKLREKCAVQAQEIKELYMSLLQCLEDIEINEILVQTLQILQSYRAVGIMYEALANIQIEVTNHSWLDNKICKGTLIGCIYNVLSVTGIGELYLKVYEEQIIAQKTAEIERLEKLAEKIIGADYRYSHDKQGNEKPNAYRDWYKTHIFDNNSYTWRKRQDWEIDKEIFPWMSKRVKYHNAKAGQSFVLSKVQKIKVLNVGNFRDMLSLAWNEHKDKELTYNDNSYHQDDKANNALLIEHIGEVNNGSIQVVMYYELREILEQAGVIQKYNKIIW